MKVKAVVFALTFALSGLQSFAADETVKPKVAKEKAEQTALKAVPGGEVLGWDLEVEKGVPNYSFDIKGRDGRVKEIEIDGNTGKKSEESIEVEEHGTGTDRKSSNASDLAKLKAAKTTKEQAEAKALKAVPGKVERWESEIEDGQLEYEFLISGKGGRKEVVGVSGKTGEVTETSTYVDGNGI